MIPLENFTKKKHGSRNEYYLLKLTHNQILMFSFGKGYGKIDFPLARETRVRAESRATTVLVIGVA